MREVLTRIVPIVGMIRIDMIVIMKRSKLAVVRVEKWIPNDPRNERAQTHMWRKSGFWRP